MKKNNNAYSDSELLKLLEGEKEVADEAFKIIYNKHASRVHAYCLRILNNTMQAEDIFQETFVRFYQRARADFKMGSIAGFLITIARNLCLNYKRDKKSHVQIEDFHHVANDELPIYREDTKKMITAALDLLEWEYREPLVLRLYDGMKYEDIAEICGITVQNARKRVFRAKQKVRTVLEPHFKELFD